LIKTPLLYSVLHFSQGLGALFGGANPTKAHGGDGAASPPGTLEDSWQYPLDVGYLATWPRINEAQPTLFQHYTDLSRSHLELGADACNEVMLLRQTNDSSNISMLQRKLKCFRKRCKKVTVYSV